VLHSSTILEIDMSKPTQAGKHGGNSKLEETRNRKQAGNASSSTGNKQSASADEKSGSKAAAGKKSAGSKSK
jgi:hypothetical protein